MKKLLFTLILSLFFYSVNNAQSGTWTWMHGSNLPNATGNYGTQGIASPTNVPPETYEGCEWTDLNGDFWYYGGSSGTQLVSALWKYNPTTNLWTWVHGPNTFNNPAVHGTIGVSAPGNSPGPREYGASTWVDLQGDLWLFGGTGLANNKYSDLWKYNIASNMWTWMNGPNTPSPPNSYGTQGVSSPLNYPPNRVENNATWVDNVGNLWLFGGSTSCGAINDLWKYDISTNQWTWVRGSNTCNAPGNYGAIGVASPTNEPPAAMYVYAKWKDTNGDFWFMEGDVQNNTISMHNELWRYNVASNQWTCIRQALANGIISSTCVSNSTNQPAGRFEVRTCWVDDCGKFWLFGGYNGLGGVGTTIVLNDLWCYNPQSNEWTFVNGNIPESFGVQNVSTISNQPPVLLGAVPFHHKDGSLWLFGGLNILGKYNSMWRYVIDTACIPCVTVQNPVAGFTGTNLTGCASLTANFTDTSSNAISWIWSFGDGNTSSAQNPSHTYTTPGQYTVTLIASNGNNHDTSTTVNYVTVYASAVAAFSSSNDTLCLGQSVTFTNSSTNSNGTFWNFGDNNTSLATSPSHTYGATGNYTVTLFALNTNGCNDTITQNIYIKPNSTGSQNATICTGSTYTLPGGMQVTTAGVYKDTIAASNGCDSIITINLTVSGFLTSIQNPTICMGNSFVLPDGTSVNTAGTYIDTLATSNGCDSIITTNLTVSGFLSSIQNPSICIGNSFVLPDGTSVNTAGTYIDTLATSNGCDSIITTNLTVSAFLSSTQTPTICIGNSFVLPDGTSVNTAGTYIDTLATSNGCDSIITTNLTVSGFLSSIQNPSICIGNSFVLPDGTSVNTAGTYTDTLTSIGGCDSIITTNLIVSAFLTSTQNPTICNGNSFVLPSGTSVSTAGTYKDTLNSVGGCDSIITTLLNVLPHIYDTISMVSVCYGEAQNLPWGQTVYISGMYSDTSTAVNGCDSITSVLVGFHPKPAITITPSSVTLQQGQGVLFSANYNFGDTLNWFSQAGVLSSSPTLFFAPTQTSTLCALVYEIDHGCADTICVNVTIETPCPTNENLQVPNAFSPNADNVNDDFCLQGWNYCIEKFLVTIFDRWGEKVYESRNPDFCWDGTNKGKPMEAQVFVYYIKSKFINQDKAIIKKGNISLIR